MSLPVVIHGDAETEIEEAALWYEEQRPGLGLEFIAAISRVVQEIGEGPNRFSMWRARWRRAPVHRFPYVVFFESNDDGVVVWAVAHARRRPGYWVARRSPPRQP